MKSEEPFERIIHFVENAKLLLLLIIGVPALLALALKEGRWSAAFALVALIGLPIATLALERSRAPQWQVRIAVLITVIAVPVLVWVEYRAFVN